MLRGFPKHTCLKWPNRVFSLLTRQESCTHMTILWTQVQYRSKVMAVSLKDLGTVLKIILHCSIKMVLRWPGAGSGGE